MNIKKTKDPAMLFYTSDFLTGCVDLTMEERGQYITLLCLQHQKGHLSEKTIRLSLGSPSDDVIKKFIQDENGEFYNEKCEETILKRNKFTESRRNNGSLGGRPRKDEEPKNNLVVSDSLTEKEPKKNLPENENESIIKNTNKTESSDFELKDSIKIKNKKNSYTPSKTCLMLEKEEKENLNKVFNANSKVEERNIPNDIMKLKEIGLPKKITSFLNIQEISELKEKLHNVVMLKKYNKDLLENKATFVWEFQFLEIHYLDLDARKLDKYFTKKQILKLNEIFKKWGIV